jgi:hypothetical protein
VAGFENFDASRATVEKSIYSQRLQQASTWPVNRFFATVDEFEHLGETPATAFAEHDTV